MMVSTSPSFTLAVITVIILCQTPAYWGFDFTNYGAGECEVRSVKTQCLSERGAGGGRNEVSNCQDVPTNKNLGQLGAIAYCCLGEDKVDVSCLARHKAKTCAEGYSWESRDGTEFKENVLTVQGALTLHFSDYTSRKVGKYRYINHDPEVMWYESKGYTSADEDYGFRIFCNGTISRFVRSSGSNSLALILGCSIGIPLGVSAIVVGLILFCCRHKFRKGNRNDDAYTYRYRPNSAQARQTAIIDEESSASHLGSSNGGDQHPSDNIHAQEPPSYTEVMNKAAPPMGATVQSSLDRS